MKKYYDDPEENAAFIRCIDIMTRLILKYGPQVLERHKAEAADAQNSEPKKAA